MTLSEFELAQLALMADNAATSSTALFLALLGSYLLVAWLAGDKLLRYQVNLINLVFLFFEISAIVSWGLQREQAYRFARELAAIDPVFYPSVSPAPVLAFGLLMFACIPGSLKFMWDIRHPPASRPTRVER